MRYFNILQSIILLLCLILSPPLVFSQSLLTRLSQSKVLTTRSLAQKTSLQHELNQLEKKFKVFFSYELDLVGGKTVSKYSVHEKSIEKSLSNLLHPLGLDYEKLRPDYYVIVPKASPKSKGKSNKTRTNSLNFTNQKVYEMPIFDKERKLVIRPISLEKPVSGTVRDSEGNSIPGVNIIVKGTAIGTLTDTQGKYAINVPNDKDVLVFTYVGYQIQEIEIGNQSIIDVVLLEDIEALEEVIVIGFGERKAKDLTGSISTVNAAEIEKFQAVSPQFALQGNTTGVRVVNNSGDPNDAPSIFVRGIGTWNGDSQPLYVIDGQIIEPPRAGNEDEISGLGLNTPPNLWNLINPNDIESISVLKDASAAAIYGNRGANGVILITTKKGKKGKPVIEFNSKFTIQNIPTYDMLNTQQFVDLTNEMFANNLNPDITIENQLYGNNQPDEATRLTNASPQFDPNSPFFISDRTTYDWQDDMVRENAFIQSYDIRVSGATDITDYYVSGSYLNQDNLLRGNNLERYTGAVNINVDVAPWIKAGINYKYTYQLSELNNQTRLPELADVAPWQPLRDPSNALGFAPVLNPLGFSEEWQQAKLYGQGTNTNVLALSDINFRDFEITRNLGQFYVELKPMEGLTLRGSINLDYTTQDRFFLDVWSQANVFRVNGDDPRTEAPNAPNSLAGLNHRINNVFNYQSDFTATYARVFASKHTMTLTAAVQDQRHERELENIEGNNITNLAEDPKRTGYSNDIGNNSSFYNWDRRFWFGFVGRASYNYDSKYYVDFSYRRDASNGFDDDFRWGNFYSIAGAWRISSENFMQNFTFLNDLKLRGGWGEAGNDQAAVGQYAFLSGVNTGLSSTRFGSGAGDPLGNLALGALVADFPNSELSWEVVRTTYVGFDALLFDNRLNITFEWFNRKTDGILQRVELPPSVATNSPLFNIGELENRGVDLLIGYNDKIGEFTYNISGNISFLTNEVTNLYLDQPLFTGFGRVEEGRSVGHIWGYEAGGIFQNQGEIDEYFEQFEDQTIGNTDFVAPGDMFFLDVQGNPTDDEPFYSTTPDGLINSFDQTEIGKTIPGYTYGININLAWKGFDLFAGFYGEGDVDRYNDVRARFESMSGAGVNYLNTTLNRWTPQNPSTTMPRAVIGDPAGNNRFSSRYVESAAFFRLNNWQIGYSLPPSVLSKFNNVISSLRVFIGGQNNIYTFRWSTLDPVNDGFPLPKSYSIGLNAKF